MPGPSRLILILVAAAILLSPALSFAQTGSAAKSVLVLGFKQYPRDLAWSKEPFEAGMGVVRQKLSQAGLMVLDETAIEAYRGVADRIKRGLLNKTALIELAKAAKADWLAILAMSVQRREVSIDNPYNHVILHMRMQVIGLSLNRVLAASKSKAKIHLSMEFPTRRDWVRAESSAAREAAQKGMIEITPRLAARVRPGTTQLYLVRFEHFLDQHINSIISDFRKLDLVSALKITQQTQRLTRVQIESSQPAEDLRQGLNGVLLNHGYKTFRVHVSGNILRYENTTEF